jgi:hypothetical protein
VEHAMADHREAINAGPAPRSFLIAKKNRVAGQRPWCGTGPIRRRLSRGCWG